MVETQDPTNPALENAYKLAKEKGYSKDLPSFQNLISTNEDALSNIYNEVKGKGYGKDLESFKTLIGLKKKENTQSEGTSQKENTELEVQDGSLDSTQRQENELEEDNRGQLVKDIDSGKLDDTIKQLQNENEAYELANPKKPTKKDSYGTELYRSLAKGSSRLGRNIAAIPELIYDIGAIPQNLAADIFNIPSLKADSESFKETTGASNPVKDFYEAQVTKISEQQALYTKHYEGDITDNFKKGNYTDGFRMIGTSISESLPSSLSIMITGGAASAPTLLAGTTAVFGADANEEYKNENPEMNANERVIKSLGKGFSEGIFSTIGTGTIGVAAKEIIKKEGVEQGSKILKGSIVEIYKKALKKYSIPTAMLGEGLEEAATQMTQNAIDGKPITEGVSDAFLVGMASGGAFGTAIEGIKKVTKDKTNASDIEVVESTLEKEESIKNELSEQVREGDLKPKEAKDIYDNWKEVKNTLKFVPEELTTAQKAIAVDLIKEKKAIEKSIEGKDPSLVKNKKARIEEINTELENLTEVKTEFESLNTKEKQTYKDKAMDALESEAKSNGDTDYSFDNEQITERANQIYQSEIKEPDAKSETPTQEETKQAVETTTPRTEVNVGDKFNYSFGLARDGVVEVIRDLGNDIVETRYADGSIKKESKVNLLSYLNSDGKTYTELSNSTTETNTSNTNNGNSQNNSYESKTKEISDKLDKLEQSFLNNGKTKDEDVRLALDSITAEERQFLSSVKTQNSQQSTPTNNQQDLESKRKKAETSIKNKELFSDGGTFSKELGGSNVNSVPTNHRDVNGIEFVEFSNPNTGVVDVIMTGVSDNNFVGYYRLYENGKPTNKWSSKFENKSRNKENFKTMISGVQRMLPKGHEYTEKSSISTDGLRVWNQQLSRGYELQYDNNGDLITDTVAINGDAINNELGIDVNKGEFEDISVTTKEQFQEVKNALLPYLKKFGLNETNIYWDNGTVKIDLPVLKNIKKITNEATPTKDTNTNEDIRPNIEPSEQQGQNTDVQSTIEPTTSESKVDVKETVKRVNPKGVKGEFDVSFDSDGNVTKVVNTKGKEISKFREVTDKKTGKKKLQRNANYSTIFAEATGTKTENQIKQEAKQKLNTALDKNTPTDATSYALDYLARGNKLDPTDTKNQTGLSDQEVKWATFSNKKGVLPGIEKAAESIVENATQDLDMQDVVNALIDLVGSNTSVKDLQQTIIDQVDADGIKQQQQELYAYKNSLSTEELAKFESIKAEDDYISELTDAEALEYFESQYGQEDTKDNDAIGTPETTSVQERTGTQESAKPTKSERKQIAKAKVDDIADAIKGIDSIFGIKIRIDDVDGLDKNGIDIVNLIASIAKQAIDAGIEIDVAIQKTIAHFKTKFDFDVSIDDIKSKLNPPKQTKQAKPKTDSKIKGSQFEKLANDMPNTGEVKDYLSGETTEKYTGETPQNDQNYLTIKLTEALMHGVNIIEEAKALFGKDYVSKTLAYLDDSAISPDKKALIYVSLANQLNKDKLLYPDNKLTIQKQLDLVNTKRQAFARSNSIALNMSRLQKFAEIGYNSEEITDRLFTPKELAIKRGIEKAMQSNMDDINAEAENQEQDIEDDFEVEIPKQKKSNTVLKRELGDVWKAMKRDIKRANNDGTLSMSVPYAKQVIAATPHILKATKILAQMGFNKGSDIVNEIYRNIKEAFPGLSKKDIAKVIKDNQPKGRVSKPKKKTALDVLKQKLVDAGYSREITVTVKVENNDGRIEKVKEKRTILDWKQLAGEEGSIDNMKTAVRETLESKGIESDKIDAFIEQLEDEFHELRANIIEKSINELEYRNRPKGIVDRKTDTRRLAELYNYGLYEENTDTYDNIMNSLMGLNGFDVDTFNQLKEKSEKLSELYRSGYAEKSIMNQVNQVQKQINDILYQYSFKNGGLGFKAASLFKEYSDLSTRLILFSVGQIVQNPFSGIVQRGILKVYNTFSKTGNKKLSAQRSEVGWAVFKDIASNSGDIYGDTQSDFTGRNRTEGRLNKISDNKVYHTFISGLLGRMHLEAPDSFNKVIITKKKFEQNIIKVLTSESNPNGAISKKEAVRYVTEALTGQNFEDAKVKAKKLIDKINKNDNKKTLADNKSAITRLADSIVREALVSGGKLTQQEVEASYNAAYKSAGFDIGHEANNFITKSIQLYGTKLDRDLKKAVKDKNYAAASLLTLYTAIYRNMLTTFIGGGTNWVVITAQNMGVDIISPIYDNIRGASNKIDLATEEGVKNLENALLRKANARSVNARLLIGGVTQIAIAYAAIASGGADDMEDYLKKNKWAKKYFSYIAPSALAIWMASDNKDREFVQEIEKVFGIRGQYFSDTYKFSQAVDKLYQGYKSGSESKIDKGYGKVGQLFGGKFNSPIPWRAVRDFQNIYRGLIGEKPIKTDYKADDFWDGAFNGGFIDFINLQKDSGGSDW